MVVSISFPAFGGMVWTDGSGFEILFFIFFSKKYPSWPLSKKSYVNSKPDIGFCFSPNFKYVLSFLFEKTSPKTLAANIPFGFNLWV